MDITQVQNRSYNRTSAYVEEESLDQLLTSAAASLRAADDEVRIQPEPDNLRTQPISESEIKLYDLEQAILSGELSLNEIKELVKTIGKNGKLHFSTINDQVMALTAVYVRVSQDSPDNPVLPTLAKASNDLLYLRNYNAELIDSITNPNLLNGGRNPFEVE